MPTILRNQGNKNKMYANSIAILSITEHFTVSYINICFLFSNSNITIISQKHMA